MARGIFGQLGALWQGYRMRLRRRRCLWRAFRARHGLTVVVDRTDLIDPGQILLFCVLRNEALRLPWFLKHYRRLGVQHFLFIDNDSSDGSAELLSAAPDVSLWHARGAYREARFGMDWLNWLLMRHGHGHWCVIADADELLDYAGSATLSLPGLTAALDRRGVPVFGAFLLDLFPRGALGAQEYRPGQDPLTVLDHFDPAPLRMRRQAPMDNLWLQGGPRERVFFADRPERAPTLNKLPLVRWHWRYAFVNAAHSILPRHLNSYYAGPGGCLPRGVLLHTKFLPDIIDRTREDMARGQHFAQPEAYRSYHAAILSRPMLWREEARSYRGIESLLALNLVSSPEQNRGEEEPLAGLEGGALYGRAGE